MQCNVTKFLIPDKHVFFFVLLCSTFNVTYSLCLYHETITVLTSLRLNVIRCETDDDADVNNKTADLIEFTNTTAYTLTRRYVERLTIMRIRS